MGLLENAAKAGAPRFARIAHIRLVLAMNPKPRQNAAFFFSFQCGLGNSFGFYRRDVSTGR